MILTRGALNAFLALAVTSFLLVFLYNHLVTEVSDVEAAKDPWRHGFPSWYGRQEKVVEERYDTRILLKDRLLLLTNLTGTSSSQLSFMNDLTTHLRPHLDVSIKTLLDHQRLDTYPQVEATSIESAIDWCAYDMIWTFGGGIPNINREFYVGCQPIWIHETGHHETLTAETHHHNADITLLKRPRDMVYELQYEKLHSNEGGESQMGLIAHVLPSASPKIFYPSRKLGRWSRRSITYFTRYKNSRGVPRSWNVYRLRDIPQTVPDWPRFWSARAPTLNETFSMHQALDREKAEVIRNSWICLFDDFDEGYLSELMVEAMMAGCVVAAVPSAANSQIKDLILPIHTDPFGISPDNEDPTGLQRTQAIVKSLPLPLRPRDKHSLAIKMVKGVTYAYDRLNHERKLKTVEDLVQRWREGERGYLFPEGISLDCHSGSKSSRPPWCAS